MPVDFLSLIGTVMNAQQRAQDSAREREQFNRELAFRGSQSAAEREARAREIADRMALEREQFGGAQSLQREQDLQRQRQFESELGLNRDRLGMQGDQFARELGFRGTESAADRALKAKELQSRTDLADREFLAQLYGATKNPDILDLLGQRVGAPMLGAYQQAASMPRPVKEIAYPLSMMPGDGVWRDAAGRAVTESEVRSQYGDARFPAAGRARRN